jgi:arsenical pump membrane protein
VQTAIPRTAILGGALLALGALAMALGILPLSAAALLWERTWPILLFVIAITVITELAAAAGLFSFVAQQAARWGRGRAWLLWMLVVALATASTIFLSLDTTAVLLTPVVIVLARHVKLNPLPFALTTVWLANTASLLLPVSNLTNLLAQHQLGGMSPIRFAALTWAPALVAIIIPVIAIFLVFRRQLTGKYEPDAPATIPDRVLFAASAVVVVALVPALVSGVAVWIPAVVAAVSLIVVFAVRRRRALGFALVPWQLLLLAAGLFLVIEAAHFLGLGAALAMISGHGDGLLSLLRLAGAGAAGANIADNLPAFLAIAPAADTPARVVALLIGVNAGPLITPWASLATLLWHQRLVAMHVRISWARYALLGLVVAPLTVAAATLVLALVG